MLRSLLLILLATVCFAAEPIPTYHVVFRAVTAKGESVPVHVTALADPAHQRDLAPLCEANRCHAIPEGAYSYVLTLDANGRKVEGSAVIYRANQIVVVDVGGVAGELDEDAFPRIAGKIVHTDNPGRFWVRLQPLYSEAAISVKVEQDGQFTLGPVRPGNWMLMVFDEGKLIHFEPFVCLEANNPPLRIDLREPPGVIRAREKGSKDAPANGN